MENKESLRYCQRPEQTDEKNHQMQNGTRDWILERKEDINGKIGEIPMKSGVWLIIMYWCQFLNSDKYVMVMQRVNNGENWM